METINKYQYLFPFERINKEDKIIIYGAGIVGREYYKQIKMTNYCQIVAFIDKEANRYHNWQIPVYTKDELNKLQYDYIVIAQKDNSFLKAIVSYLIDEMLIRPEKIIYVDDRKEIVLEKNEYNCVREKNNAYEKTEISLALSMSGGYGDRVISKKVVQELIGILDNVLIDIFTISREKFMSYLYSDCNSVNRIVYDDSRQMFISQSSLYKLSLRISPEKIDVLHYDVNYFKNNYPEFAKRMDILIDTLKEENADKSFFELISKRIYRGLDQYSAQKYGGAFDIVNENVSIPLTEKGRKEFNKLNLNSYITINCGDGNERRGNMSKAWPSDRFEKLIELIKKEFPGMKIVQTGQEDAHKLIGADKDLTGMDFETTVHVWKNALLHIDIEGGPVHIASQLGTKCIVLFGPTQKDYFGYKNNINIQVGNCQGCHGLMKYAYDCARGMREPKCMYSITPELVMREIRKVFV